MTAGGHLPGDADRPEAGDPAATSTPSSEAQQPVPLGRFAYVRPLDGMRAIAVLLVLGFHGKVPGLHGGLIGVDIFFVLSGFLITSLLLDEVRINATIKVGAFYMRRALRLVPALVACIVGVLVLILAGIILKHLGVNIVGPSLRHESLTAIPFTLTYTSNIMRAADWSEGGLLSHTWSLSIEEQFYLFWPLMIVLVHRRRHLVRWVFGLAVGGALASAVLRIALLESGVKTSILYDVTLTRADGLLLGCAAATLWLARPAWFRRTAHPLVLLAGLGALAAVVLLATGTSRWMYQFGLLLVSIAACVVIVQLVANPVSAVGRVLATRPAVWIGRRSYGLYLYHWPILIALGGSGFSIRSIVGLAATFAVAALSYRYVEQPFLAKKDRWLAIREPGRTDNSP